MVSRMLRCSQAHPSMPIVLQPTPADSAPTGGKILLVDDDEDLLEALSFLLRRAGFSPLTATSLPAAIRLFDCERPELAVLDVDLGRWSGLDLLQQLRERSNIPILMLTGSVSEHLKARSLALGADDCLTKPISAGQLIARIRAVLAQHLHAREQADIQIQLSSALLATWRPPRRCFRRRRARGLMSADKLVWRLPPDARADCRHDAVSTRLAASSQPYISLQVT